MTIHDKSAEELAKPVTLGLLFEFTEEVLLPRMSDLIDEKLTIGLGSLEAKLMKEFARRDHEMKDYIDCKLADHTADMFARLDRKYQTDKQFKEKVVELFKRTNVANPEELAFLQGLIAGSS